MKGAKEELIEAQRKAYKNWITRQCLICGERVNRNIIVDRQAASLENVFICTKCLNRD